MNSIWNYLYPNEGNGIERLPERTTMPAKPTVCRVSMIPDGDAASREAELLASIQGSLETTEWQHVNGIEISIVRSCYDPQMLTALVYFKSGLPEFLKRLREDPLCTHQFKMGDCDIVFDQSFHGLTQLYNPKVNSTKITADVIAITGLDGHAYGSWSGGNPKRMWLREFLSDDLPKCRVMTYGYNSKLSTPGLHTIADFGRSLREELVKARTNQVAFQLTGGTGRIIYTGLSVLMIFRNGGDR